MGILIHLQVYKTDVLNMKYLLISVLFSVHLASGYQNQSARSEVPTLVNKIVDVVKDDITSTMRKENDHSLAEAVRKLTIRLDDLQKKYDELKVPKWPSGSYCILANGNCPVGFRRDYGFMRAISIFGPTTNYITPANFGSSRIQCHGRCGQFGNWIGELHLTTCCK